MLHHTSRTPRPLTQEEIQDQIQGCFQPKPMTSHSNHRPSLPPHFRQPPPADGSPARNAAPAQRNVNLRAVTDAQLLDERTRKSHSAQELQRIDAEVASLESQATAIQNSLWPREARSVPVCVDPRKSSAAGRLRALEARHGHLLDQRAYHELVLED